MIIPNDIWKQSKGWKAKFIETREPDTETERILIVGLGRAGTTFLIQLLTRLGYDTGAEPNKEPITTSVRAGFELALLHPSGLDEEVVVRAPQIIKGPLLSIKLDEVFDKKVVPVKHVICPIREMRATATSREQTGLFYISEHKTMPIEERIPNLFSVLGKITESCTLYDKPLTTIAFPRMVKDSRYLYNKLFKDSDIFDVKYSYPKFKEVYDKLANPKMIQTKI